MRITCNTKHKDVTLQLMQHLTTIALLSYMVKDCIVFKVFFQDIKLCWMMLN